MADNTYCNPSVAAEQAKDKGHYKTSCDVAMNVVGKIENSFYAFDAAIIGLRGKLSQAAVEDIVAANPTTYDQAHLLGQFKKVCTPENGISKSEAEKHSCSVSVANSGVTYADTKGVMHIVQTQPDPTTDLSR
jgi:hypothetical protein